MAAYPFEQNPPRPASRLYKRFLLGALVIVMATSAAVSTAALLEVKSASDIIDEFSTPIAGLDEPNVLDDVDPGGPQTILLLGSDRRFVDIATKSPARSDTIILLRLDPSRGATAVMSIPRDLRVDIPGHGRRKINEAYALGGPKLTVQTVRKLLGVPINHVVNVNFGGFQRAVNRLGCVYADIDRRYFNDNSGPQQYAVIDVEAGYQRLCGKAALEYVRYRHADNDVVRGARQQDFLRQAKAQIGVSKLFSDRRELIKIFFKYADTDIRGTSAILRLLKLTVESAKNPIQEVQIKDLEDEGPFLVASSRPSKTRPWTSSSLRRRRARGRTPPTTEGHAPAPSARPHASRAVCPRGSRSRAASPRTRPSRWTRSSTFPSTSRGCPSMARPCASAIIAPTTCTTAAGAATARIAWSSTPRGRDRTTAYRERTGRRRRSSTARRRSARSAAGRSSSSTTVTGCASSPGGPTRRSTGCRTRCCRR